MIDVSSQSDREFRKWLVSRLIPDQPLEPDNELYEPLYDGVAGDPVELLYEDIDLSETESLNFISGFRGSGKTTELFRLRRRLVHQGYFVVYANALDYVLPSEPVEITDFLLVLAGSFSEAIETALKIDLAQEGFWARIVQYFTKTQVQLEGVDLRAGLPGTSSWLNFKTSLKEAPSFRQSLRQKLAGRLGELRREVHEFFEFGCRKIRAQQGGRTRGVVFIFDQFEQLRDTLDTEGRVAESVTTLIANHRSDLRVPGLHVVFTLPPWLKFKLPELRNVRLLYNVKLWNNNAKRTPARGGWSVMQRMVQRRFTPTGLARFFGPLTKKGSHKMADKLIGAAGGHFRDLLVLLHETVLRAQELPVKPAVVEAAINGLRKSYFPMPLADAQWLHRIGLQRDSLLKDRTPESVQRMTFFLDTHCALILQNGDEWYDVHPLIRDEIAELVRREEQAGRSGSDAD